MQMPAKEYEELDNSFPAKVVTTCTVETMLFKSLFAAAALASTAFAAPNEKRQSRKMKWFGINESGAEFGEKNFTGVYGKEFIWYDLKTIDVSLHTAFGDHTKSLKPTCFSQQ